MVQQHTTGNCFIRHEYIRDMMGRYFDKKSIPLVVITVASCFLISMFSHYKEPSPACHCDEQQPLPPAQQSYELRFDDPVTQRCSKREDVCKAYVLVKVSKTGTTTLCTILSRYLHLNNLTMITPASGYAIQWWRSRNSGWVMRPDRKIERADTLINHALYNRYMLGRYITPGYKLVVPVREPVAWFKSSVNYLTNKRTKPHDLLKDKHRFFLTRPENTSTGQVSLYHLGQLQWLGFDYKQRDNITAIKEYITWIISRTDVIMLNEQFMASVLILRRRFCWSYSDMFYQSGNILNSEVLDFSEEDRLELLKRNHGEVLLYEAMNTTWWAQDEVTSGEIFKEVEYFDTLNSKIPKYCEEVTKTQTDYIIEETRWHETVHLTPLWCKAFTCMKPGPCLFSEGECIRSQTQS